MRMMLRNDEELRGPSHRNKRVHIAEKEKPGMKSLCCNTLDLYCRQLTKRIPKTSRGILKVDRMSEPDQE
jgi:hypothetical protein